MKRGLDLNIASIENYPIIKVLTKSDMTTSQLVLPRRSVEEHVVAYLDEQVRNRLTSGDGRMNIWVVDDQQLHEYYLTMVDREHRYFIISWSHVLQNRVLTEGQKLRFGWINQKLHFIVEEKEDDEDEAEENKANEKDNEGDEDQGGQDEEVAEPEKKKAKQDLGEALTL